ncbi:MAG: aromatic ring-hydroxylating dioxygenase subunit alpha [Acidobacteriota bacterium]
MAATRRSSLGAHTLAGRYYTCDSIYGEENDRIFSSHWCCVGRCTPLSEPGSYFLCDLEKENLVLLRDSEGVPRAFYNVCRHRGARLCNQNSGRFSKTIQCPYHAWTYGLDGELLAAPNMEEAGSFSRSRYPLIEVASRIWEGFVFLNLAETPTSFEEEFGPLGGKFRSWHLAELTTVHHEEYLVEANWKLIFQNYSECYHCPTLHPLLNRLSPYRDSLNDLESGPFLGGPMTISSRADSMTMSGRSCAAPLDQGNEHRNRVYYYSIFPTLLLSLHPDYVLVHRIEPESPGQTRVVCEWLFHPDAVTQPGFDPSEAIDFWHITNEQDWRICESTQRGLRSRAFVPGPYSELESLVAAFDRHYLRVMGHG